MQLSLMLTQFWIVLEIITQLWRRTFVKMLPKPTNKYSINTVIKYYKHMILSDYFPLASVSENSILIFLKATQASKAACIDILSCDFLKDGSKELPKLISDLCNLSITSVF